MRVAITGITGFLGRHLSASLRAAGDEVVGFADEPSAVEGVEVAGVDLLDAPAITAWVEQAAPDAIVHLAGLSHVGASFDRPGDYHRINLVGTRNVLRAATAGGRTPRLLFASSAEVYGCVPEAEQPIAESRRLEPRSPYAMTKAAAEVLALDAGAVVTRSFNIIGPGQAPSFALPSFARQLAAIRRGESEPVVRVGDLSPRRDFTHVADAVEAYRLLISAGASGQVYNVARGRAVSIAHALERLCAIAGVEVEVRRDPSRVRPVDVPMLCGDPARLEAAGWRPRYGFEAALNDLWLEVVEPGGPA